MRNVKEDIEMSDEKSSAKGVSPRLIPWQSSLFVPLLALTLGVCGCKSSAFAPRTGEREWGQAWAVTLMRCQSW